MSDTAFLKQIKGYSLTTAEILYHLPDHPTLLQTFLWQNYDLAPRFPQLQKFLEFWKSNLDGPLHGIRVSHSKLIKPAECNFIDGEFVLH